jgi:hypothetical protein
MNHTSTAPVDDGNDVESIVIMCFVIFMIICMILACKKSKDNYQRDLERHAEVFGRNPRQFTLSV